MKKVLIYNGQLFMGGIERVLITYLSMLSKEKDLDITLLIKENNPERNVFAKDIPENIKIEYVKKEKDVKARERVAKKRKNPLYRLMYQIYLSLDRVKMRKFVKRYFSENRFDTVIDFDMSLGKYISGIKGKKIGWCHFSLEAKKGKKRERFRRRCSRYDKLVVICDEMEREMAEIYPEYVVKTARIYNPMDVEKIRIMGKNKKNLIEQEKKLIEQPYMIAVSRLVKSKGREDLIEIYPSLKKRGIAEKLYIIGNGEEYNNLKELIKRLNLEEDVLLLGEKKSPYVWMKNAKLFLHPSYGEGLPTVMIESMINDCPVIAYDCPTGPSEILGEGKYGILVKTGDKKGFEDAVCNLLKSPEKIENYKAKFAEQIEKFEEKSILKQIKSIL